MVITPALTMGGMERASSTLAIALEKMEDVKVTLLLILSHPHFFKISPGISIIEPEGFNKKKLSIVKTISYLRKYLKTEAPDSVLVYGKFYGALAVLSNIGLGKKIFISERSSPLLKWPLKQRVFNHMAYTLAKPYGVIAQTNIAKKIQQSYFGAKVPIVVVPNAIREIELYSSIPREEIILCIGRLNDVLKGFDRVLETFALIKDQCLWNLVIIGGVSDAILNKIIEIRNLKERVIFIDKANNIDEWIAKAGIFALPSRSEGFPNALCEAMIGGAPCISFDFIAGPRDIIKHEVNGLLVPDGDIELFAASLLDLINNKNKRLKLGQNAKGLREKLNEDNIAQQIYAILLKDKL